MDYKLTDKIVFKRWHAIATLLLVIILGIGIYSIRQKVAQQSDKLSNSIIHGSTIGYQQFLNSYFDNYNRALQQLTFVLKKQTMKQEDRQTVIKSILKTNSTIAAIGILENKTCSVTQSDSLRAFQLDMNALLYRLFDYQNSHIYKERYMFIGEILDSAKHKACVVVVDLHQLHRQFITDNIYTSVYQVVINQDKQCIYHPEIQNIGKAYALPDYLYENKRINTNKFDTLHVEKSKFLQLPVFKEYNQMQFRNEAWIVLNVSPGFEVKDMVAEQEGNMFLLTTLFLFILLIIIIFSIVSWKREFVLRATAEQEHLNLLLKHEKQKSDTISIKLELLRSGLNSHFMFNSLGTVKALLQKDAEAARSMIMDLSQLYRYQLRIEGEQLVTLREELDFTLTYVDVINLRSRSSISMNITNLSGYLEHKVLPVSLQLLVENCIKHNIASETRPLSIFIEVRDEYIIVENELRPKESIGESSGKGLKNLNMRYKLIAQKECTFKNKDGKYTASVPLLN